VCQAEANKNERRSDVKGMPGLNEDETVVICRGRVETIEVGSDGSRRLVLTGKVSFYSEKPSDLTDDGERMEYEGIAFHCSVSDEGPKRAVNEESGRPIVAQLQYYGRTEEQPSLLAIYAGDNAGNFDPLWQCAQVSFADSEILVQIKLGTSASIGKYMYDDGSASRLMPIESVRYSFFRKSHGEGAA
jgi:hypothetical protein